MIFSSSVINSSSSALRFSTKFSLLINDVILSVCSSDITSDEVIKKTFELDLWKWNLNFVHKIWIFEVQGIQCGGSALLSFAGNMWFPCINKYRLVCSALTFLRHIFSIGFLCQKIIHLGGCICSCRSKEFFCSCSISVWFVSNNNLAPSPDCWHRKRM